MSIQKEFLQDFLIQCLKMLLQLMKHLQEKEEQLRLIMQHKFHQLLQDLRYSVIIQTYYIFRILDILRINLEKPLVLMGVQ